MLDIVQCVLEDQEMDVAQEERFIVIIHNNLTCILKLIINQILKKLKEMDTEGLEESARQGETV